MKPIPKSLHTVTVLAAIAAHLRAADPHLTPRQAAHKALVLLGYASNTPDVYGLIDRAAAAQV